MYKIIAVSSPIPKTLFKMWVTADPKQVLSESDSQALMQALNDNLTHTFNLPDKLPKDWKFLFYSNSHFIERMLPEDWRKEQLASFLTQHGYHLKMIDFINHDNRLPDEIISVIENLSHYLSENQVCFSDLLKRFFPQATEKIEQHPLLSQSDSAILSHLYRCIVSGESREGLGFENLESMSIGMIVDLLRLCLLLEGGVYMDIDLDIQDVDSFRQEIDQATGFLTRDMDDDGQKGYFYANDFLAAPEDNAVVKDCILKIFIHYSSLYFDLQQINSDPINPLTHSGPGVIDDVLLPLDNAPRLFSRVGDWKAVASSIFKDYRLGAWVSFDGLGFVPSEVNSSESETSGDESESDIELDDLESSSLQRDSRPTDRCSEV